MNYRIEPKARRRRWPLPATAALALLAAAPSPPLPPAVAARPVQLAQGGPPPLSVARPTPVPRGTPPGATPDAKPDAKPEATGRGEAERSGAGTAYLAGQFVGPAPCAAPNCHGNLEPGHVYDVLQNEFYIWSRETDPHRNAAEPLFNQQSRLIARNLGLKQSADRSARCLVCHALDVPESAQAVPLELADGISCEACHGPAGGWLARHNETGWTHADSVAAGMVELRDPRARARVCLDCHGGKAGRQVDHELLAAGHPELVFELDNYTESMPAHWMPFADRHDTAGRRDTHGLVAWAVGQTEAFRQGVLLLRHRAASDRWPEFAELTCDGCHHDLAGGRWRQVRGYRLRAGLPSWSPARWTVLRHLLAAVAPRERAALDGDVDRLAEQVSRLNTPAPTLAATAQRIADGLDRALPRLAAHDWNEGAARALLVAIAGDRAGLAAADRESAEQVAYAAGSLVANLGALDPKVARGRLPALVDALYAELDDPYRWDRERFGAVLAEIEKAAASP
jgi:hypothetical protein